MMSRTPWGKLAALFSLKAVFLACLLTPVTVSTVGITSANAQFQIIIPGFGGYGYRGNRRYYRSYSRRPRAGRGGGGATQQKPAGMQGTPVTSSKGYKGGSD
jgi:hypothetical protein